MLYLVGPACRVRRLCLTEPRVRRCLSPTTSDDGAVDERYLMRAERKRRRKLARQARVLNVGRYSIPSYVRAGVLFAVTLPAFGVFCLVCLPLAVGA